MFQVGKKVICIKDHSQCLVKKGDVFPLFGIKKGCCGSCKLMLDIGKVNDKAAMECPNCNYFFITDVLWIDSNLFAPYDDELSDVSVNELLEELFPEHVPVTSFEREVLATLKKLRSDISEIMEYTSFTCADLMMHQIIAINNEIDLFTLNRDN